MAFAAVCLNVCCDWWFIGQVVWPVTNTFRFPFHPSSSPARPQNRTKHVRKDLNDCHIAGCAQQVFQLRHSQEARQPFFPGGKGKLADGRNGGGAAADEKLVKRAQGGEPELHGGAAQLAAAEEAEKIPKIIPAQRVPIRRRLALALEPARELQQRLPVIPFRIDRGLFFRQHIPQKLQNPRVRLRLRRLVHGNRCILEESALFRHGATMG